MPTLQAIKSKSKAVPIANKSSVKPRSEQTKGVTTTVPGIQIGQSTEVTQTLVHASISCVAFLRNLFPEDCFDEQVYDASNTHLPYDEYARGVSSTTEGRGLLKKGAKVQGTTFKVLRRGRRNQVDLLLDSLENGAFEALKKNVLRAIQLNIFENREEPSNVLEAYTFTFRYAKSANGKTLEAFELKDLNGKPLTVTVGTSKHALQMFIRRVLSFCNTLPDLPMRRYLTMNLFYTDDCDPDYEPAGFERRTDDRIFFPADDDWKKDSHSCGIMNVGFHKVGLKVSYLLRNDLTDTLDQGSAGILRIPNDKLTYKAPVSSEDDIEMRLIDEDNDRSSPAKTSAPLAKHHDRTSRKQTHVAAVTNGDDLDHTHVVPDSMEWQESNSSTAAQIVADAKVTDQLLKIASPEYNPDVSLYTNDRTKLEPSTQGQSLEATQLVDSVTTSLEQHRLDELNVHQLQLSQFKLKELELKRSAHSSKQNRDNGDGFEALVQGIAGQGTIDCQCGWNEEDDDMVHCTFCDTWQHLICYGYRSSEDLRIPVVHACYKCLLQQKEAPILRELKDFVLLRRGVHALELEGFHSEKTFAEALHCDIQTASGVAKHLRNKGYMIAAAGSKKKGFSQTGKPKFVMVKSEPMYTEMLEEYFNPKSKIAHHFELPDRRSISTASLSPDLSHQPVSRSTQKQHAHVEGSTATGLQTAQVNGHEPAESHGLRGTRQPPSDSQRLALNTVTEGIVSADQLSSRKRGRKAEENDADRSMKRRMKSSQSNFIISVGLDGTSSRGSSVRYA